MKLPVLSVTLSLSALALLSALLIVDAKANNDLAVIAAITKIETDTVQADLANDRPFLRNYWPATGPLATAVVSG